jgi:FKBP-type peptidyl-prolyl cis-trans isomerase FkpA
MVGRGQRERQGPRAQRGDANHCVRQHLGVPPREFYMMEAGLNEGVHMTLIHHKGHPGRKGKNAFPSLKTIVSVVSFVVVRVVLLLAAAGAAACGSDTAPTDVVTTTAPYSATDLVLGTGATAINGSRVTVTYAGWLHDSSRTDAKGAQFDSNQVGFPFTLGTGSVIAGWERGVAGMRVGGQRRLVIPPDLAYGSRGSGPIPPNATLVFDVTLLNVQ